MVSPDLDNSQTDGVLIECVKLLLEWNRNISAGEGSRSAIEKVSQQLLKVFHQREYFAFLPEFLKLTRDPHLNERVPILVGLLEKCDVDKDDFAFLLHLFHENPSEFSVLASWRDLFRKRRTKVAGVAMLPENHTGKLAINPLRLAPTRNAEYIDSDELEKCYQEMQSAIVGHGIAEAVDPTIAAADDAGAGAKLARTKAVTETLVKVRGIKGYSC